ncbi:MAG: hypothetical protein OER74_09005, partial [Desulfobacteraceae bacterium]|nr:hypothetical protein [Desulfobacteraceae bacterium]
SIFAMSFFSGPNSLLSIKPKILANNIEVTFFEYFFAFHLNPWTLDPLDPSVVFIAFHSNPCTLWNNIYSIGDDP